MKNTLIALLAVQFLLISCSKNQDQSSLISETATISKTKFPCGPACTAETWLLVTDNISYEPVNLPDNYKIAQLPVKVTLKKTGLRSGAWDGSGEEKVEVINIVQR
ncbi:MAG: hypothetical protein EOO02_04385 [Chitinophagaceae bacterium]|nr:MAG: hypothetical protein EOO02_04385 [Chitinophagaceae bacterium]